MKKKREHLHKIFYGKDLLEYFKSFLLKIFSLKNLGGVFQRKSINFSSKLRSHEDLIAIFGRSSMKISFISSKRFDNISTKDSPFGIKKYKKDKYEHG